MALEIASRGTAAQQAQYRAGVQAVLSIIRTRAVGSILLRHLESAPRLVRIVPYGAADVHDMGQNAYADPLNPAGADRHGRRAGGGSVSEVHFSPSLWARDRRVQSTPDEVLLHELCHAYRQINGLQRQAHIASFENVEEYFAALVASVYSSENNRPPLGNHGFWTLRDPAVLGQPPYSTWLDRFRATMPGLTRELGQIPANRVRFNPFRDIGVHA